MANRVLLGDTGGNNFGLKISKPGEDVLTTADKNLIFDSTKNRNGQVLGGGVDINFDNGTGSNPSETQGLNYLTVTGVRKSQPQFIPLIIHVEKNVGEINNTIFPLFYISDIDMLETSGTLVCPVSLVPTNDTNDTNANTTTITAATPTKGRAYSFLTDAQEDCLNCSYYVLQIPCAYGYMTSSNF